MVEAQTFPHNPVVPYDSRVSVYDLGYGHASPLEYTGWKEEAMSWKETCYLHGGLNPSLTYRVTGPDATKLFNHICTNNVERLKVGSSTHALLCSEKGNIMAHGMLLRLGEEDYLSYWLDPVVSAHVNSGKFDVVGEDLTGKRFLFQIGGPRSLEVLETALGEDLHDIRFLRHREAEIGAANIGITGTSLSVLRIGMAGTLSYEVHGEIEDAIKVYNAIYEAGQQFGLVRLGAVAYWPLNHTENGFPQGYGHFAMAFDEDALLRESTENGLGRIGTVALRGSMGDDLEARYCNPVDLGWGKLVRLDHDFIGREALAEIKERPAREMVTLIWNPEDILDTYRSQFEPGEEYKLMAFPCENEYAWPGKGIYNDQVLKDGELVGMSMGRIYSYYYRKMISICPIRHDLASPGTEVAVLWGEPGTRQKEIRATVAPFPILDLPRNEHIDVESIPRLATA